MRYLKEICRQLGVSVLMSGAMLLALHGVVGTCLLVHWIVGDAGTRTVGGDLLPGSVFVGLLDGCAGGAVALLPYAIVLCWRRTGGARCAACQSFPFKSHVPEIAFGTCMAAGCCLLSLLSAQRFVRLEFVIRCVRGCLLFCVITVGWYFLRFGGSLLSQMWRKGKLGGGSEDCPVCGQTAPLLAIMMFAIGYLLLFFAGAPRVMFGAR